MSSDVVISLKNVTKQYEVYPKPSYRLWQTLLLGRKKFYKTFSALNDISFDISKGECIGVVGRNGAGKSTLLQIITGTLSPTSGEVSIKGRIGALLELGSGFNSEFTGRENIYVNAAIIGFKNDKIQEKISDIIAFADIGDFIDQPLKTYSSGMMLRLAFAVQTQIKPDILIIDEALAVGDAVFQKRCYARINELKKSGTTIFFVSHDQEAVRTITDRCLLLEGGKQVMFGETSEVLLKYRGIINACESEYAKSSLSVSNDITSTNSNDSDLSLLNKQCAGKHFGGERATILDVGILNVSRAKKDHFFPHEKIIIQVKFNVKEKLSGLNINLRIRNLQGVKIYSWGTLNQDMVHATENKPVFADKEFLPDRVYSVDFSFVNNLGDNFYEVQAGISHEPRFNYTEQIIYHWVDEAAFFYSSFAYQLEGYFFGGTTNLNMEAKLNE